jgi:putative transport protein
MIRVAGLSLGSSGVLFVALLFGHLGRETAWSLPDGMGIFGLVLFVYTIGLSAGSTFFRTIMSQGRQLALLSVIVVSLGGMATIAASKLFGLPAGFAAGLFAGSMTSTPALAASIEAVGQGGGDPTAASIGYGLAYPIGVITTVLFVQALPRLLRIDLEELSHTLESANSTSSGIHRYLVEVCNPAVIGKRLSELQPLQDLHGQLTRAMQGERLVPIQADHVLEAGQIVMLVADAEHAETLTMILGRPASVEAAMDVDRDRAWVVVTNPDVLERPLRELHLRGRFGVTISRIERYGASFVPSAKTILMMGDRLTVVGPPEGLRAFLKAAGHRVRKLHETDLMSLAAGLAAGIALGQIPIPVPGVGTITLGLAGGPLLAGLLFAHFGRFLGVVGYMPLAARMLAQELGLVMFLAAAGFTAGGSFLEYVREYGVAPFVASALIALVPLAGALAASRWVFRIDLLQTLGGTCGAMTSTAALGTLTSKTDSERPITSYAAAYPMALVLMTIAAQLIVLSVG